MSAFEAAGVAVYALSYDEPEALADFAAKHGITFTFLSDPDSEVITEFGILNTLIPPDDHPWHGIPFPGAYIIDSEGIIRSKFFEGRLAIRASGDQLLRAVAGEPPALPDDGVLAALEAAAGSAEFGEVAVRVWTKARHLPPGIVADLIVEFTPPTGWHVYGEPVPRGMVATAVKLDDAREVTISGVVRWQACDDTTCSVPRTHRFALRLPSGPIAMPHYPSPERPLEPGQMDSTRHFAKMRERR